MSATAGSGETRTSKALPATWLAQRLGVDPARIDAMRRSGELVAVREPGSPEWRYPGWQFDGGKPRPGLGRIVQAARDSGIDEARLNDVLTTPLGLRSGGGTLVDLLVDGRTDEVVAAVRAAR